MYQGHKPDTRKLVPDPLTVLTLKEAANTHVLTADCKKCHRWREVDLGKAATRVGGDTLVKDITAKLRCSGCGSRQVILSFTDRAYFEAHTRKNMPK